MNIFFIKSLLIVKAVESKRVSKQEVRPKLEEKNCIRLSLFVNMCNDKRYISNDFFLHWCHLFLSCQGTCAYFEKA